MALEKGLQTGYGADAVYWRITPAYTIDHTQGIVFGSLMGYVSAEARANNAQHIIEKRFFTPIMSINIDGLADLRPSIYTALKSGTASVHNGKIGRAHV